MSDRNGALLLKVAMELWRAWRQHRRPSKWARKPAKRVRW